VLLFRAIAFPDAILEVNVTRELNATGRMEGQTDTS
jgi:hypothetical protein